jgi:hypothetical protein
VCLRWVSRPRVRDGPFHQVVRASDQEDDDAGSITPCAQLTLGAPSLLSAAPSTHSSVPDVILHGGRIYTGDAKQPYVEALAIRGACVSAFGDNSTILKSATSRMRNSLQSRSSDVSPSSYSPAMKA